jgi:hypothetical protein
MTDILGVEGEGPGLGRALHCFAPSVPVQIGTRLLMHRLNHFPHAHIGTLLRMYTSTPCFSYSPITLTSSSS